MLRQSQLILDEGSVRLSVLLYSVCKLSLGFSCAKPRLTDKVTEPLAKGYTVEIVLVVDVPCFGNVQLVKNGVVELDDTAPTVLSTHSVESAQPVDHVLNIQTRTRKRVLLSNGRLLGRRWQRHGRSYPPAYTVKNADALTFPHRTQ